MAALFDWRRAKLLKSALCLRDRAVQCEPTETHRWLASLRSKLLRCYTQNVDMVERKADLTTGVSRRFKCVPLHGSLANLECHICHEAYEWDDYRSDIEDYILKDDKDELTLPLPCPRCTTRHEAREASGKRPSPIGQLRPSMVMLNEPHPQDEEIGFIKWHDGLASPDLLLVLGTSLKVHGSKTVFREFARKIRGRGGKVIYVNLSKPPSDCSALIDYWVQWDVDKWVRDLKGRQGRSGPGMRGCARRGPRRDRTCRASRKGRVRREPLGSRGNPIPLD